MQLNGSQYTLRRDGDGEGDFGSELRAISPESGTPFGENGEIKEGFGVRVGNGMGRYWQTTPVTEINYGHWAEEGGEGQLHFTTKNSTYTLSWR